MPAKKRTLKQPAPDNGTALPSLLADVARRVDAGDADGSIPTGFPSVDRLLGGGLRRGDLIALGGDVGAGKSALALAVATRAAESGHAVTVYNGETSAPRVAERLLAIEGRAQIDELRRGTLDGPTRATVGAAAARLRALPITIERLPSDVGALTRRAASRRTPALFVIDPLQMLATGRLPAEEEFAQAVRQLKGLAIEAGTAVLLTTHLPQLAARSDRRPQLDDFGALGAVKQHADVVLGLFREGMYDHAPSLEGATELHVLKNRGGAAAYADLYFYAQWTRFEDLVDPDR